MKRNLFGMLTTSTLALLISVPLSAQTIAKATVPFDFTVGRAHLPAGTYEISPLAQAVILIRDSRTTKSVLTYFNSKEPSRGDSTPKACVPQVWRQVFPVAGFPWKRRRSDAASYFQTGGRSTNCR